MNKKQLISMWCGVIVFVLCLLFYIESYYGKNFTNAHKIEILIKFLISVFVIFIITLALILTFQDKKDR
jgi:hypothetical protein